ncbi:MAG: homocysteine S-methyltransferase family protein [Clostridia bacterium]|nr:homocysteine S-methyltransferase family protein [Clostridia bacterium]
MYFSQAISTRRLVLDGATGTELIKRGFFDRPELLNVLSPEILTEVHRAYVEAGSDVVCANTFGCNRLKADLRTYTLEDLVRGAIDAAKKSGAEYVLYDCGPLGELLYPNGRRTFEEAYELFAEQALLAEKYGCDGVLIETMGDLKELRCALLAFRENTSLPVLCSMSFEESGRTYLGTDAACFALTAQALGAAAVGVNCGLGPDKLEKVVDRILSVAKVPVLVKPNAGLPEYRDGSTVYSMQKEDFSKSVLSLAKRGATLVGGCCGTTPDFIKEFSSDVKSLPFRIPNGDFDGICSYAKAVPFSGKTKAIGERVNPTNRPLLKQAFLDSDFDYILGLCLEQKEEGAEILDINCGMAGVDEKRLLSGTVTETEGVVALPLCLDTGKAPALEAALRVYDGVALINSVNGEERSLSSVLPLAKRYGAYLIGLCLDERGIPQDVQTRVEIAEKIATRAKEYGIDKKRLLIDPLTMAVSVDHNNGKILLDTIEELKKRDFKTVLGLSNISYGLPARHILNGALYRLIKDRGVTAAIVNPTLKENDDEVSRTLLLGGDERCEGYIRAYSGVPAEEERRVDLSLRECVCKGRTAEGMAKLKIDLTDKNAEKIIEHDVIGGLDDLGEKYERGEVFLPALIAGSETAKAMLDYIKKNCFSEGKASRATVVIATVKGDVHDIGKNIVKTVAGNYGYRMIDLGRDVPTERVLAAIEEYRPQAVALSALMTTTLDNMTETVKAVKRAYPSIEVLVGGAVVSADYAESVGARYSKDAREACLVLNGLFG